MDLLSATKVAAAGIAGAGGSGGAVYGTYYLVTSSKSTAKEEQNKEVKETKPKFKALEKWTRDNKCNITSVVSTKPQPDETINFNNLDEEKSEKLLKWLKENNNKTTAGCGTPTTEATLKTADWTTFTK